jgi:hypothetical protein
MLGKALHLTAVVDNNPDRRRLRPAYFSKIGAETSSSHSKHSLTSHCELAVAVDEVDEVAVISLVSSNLDITVALFISMG